MIQLRDPDLDGYVNRFRPLIAMLKESLHMKTGVYPTDIEAWQYLAWASDNYIAALVSEASPDDQPTLTAIRDWVGTACADRFQYRWTHRFMPPVTTRYESPEAFETVKADLMSRNGLTPPTAAAEGVSDDTGHRGYL